MQGLRDHWKKKILRLSGSSEQLHSYSSQEDEELLEKQAAAESAGQFSTSLIFAGLCPELALAVVLGESASGSTQGGDQPSPVLLAWAVLLALLLELPPKSERRSRISQALHDNHRHVSC